MSTAPIHQQHGPLRRYIQGYSVYLRKLRKSQWLSADEMRAEQLSKLKALLRDAAENVPYYRDLFRALGATPDDFREVTDLMRLPVLEKQTLRENFDQFVNPRHNGSHVFEDHTSGSTGMPLRFL